MTWRHAVTSRRDIRTSRRDIMRSHHNVTWHHMTWQSESAQVNPSETPKITFFNLATLTFDLWPWPSNSSEIYLRSIPILNYRSVRETVRSWERQLTDRRTHTETHGTDFIPSTADAGGKNRWSINTRAFACLSLQFKSRGTCLKPPFWTQMMFYWNL